MTKSKGQLTDEERQYLKAKVDRLVYFLDASAMPLEVKSSWLTLLPDMTMDQIDLLTKMLEGEFEIAMKKAKKHSPEAELIVKLQSVKERYQKKMDAVGTKVLAELQKIEEEISKVEQQASNN